MRDLINQSINANKINGVTTLNGKLCFYEDGFVFKAQGVNSVINQPKIEYKEIVKVNSRNTLGFIPNGVSVETKNGEIHNYVVMRRKDVISFLEEMSKDSGK